jgi:hypothetical protein
VRVSLNLVRTALPPSLPSYSAAGWTLSLGQLELSLAKSISAQASQLMADL